MMIKHRIQIAPRRLILFLILVSHLAVAQQTQIMNISSCYAKAKQNYPLVKQYNLIEKSNYYSISNANKGYLPRFRIIGQATYQSEVTKVPISLPNQSIPEPSKDQYKIYGELSQPITDLLLVKYQKRLIKANTDDRRQKIEIELYALKDRIHQLYFGILLIDAQIMQMELLKKDIQIGVNKTNIAIANGVALESDANLLKAELLKVNQKIIELKASKRSFIDMLSLFINETIAENALFEKPLPKSFSSAAINRPELQLYEIQKNSFRIRSKLITAKILPRLSLFFQGGIGRPGLNMLSNEAKDFYIGGIQFNWKLSSLYTNNNEKRMIALNQNTLDIQKDIFLFNTDLQLKQEESEITKLKKLVSTDDDIITLRANIKNTVKNQLERGVATTNDYLTQVNAEDKARQNKNLHQMRLLMAQYKYQTTLGN